VSFAVQEVIVVVAEVLRLPLGLDHHVAQRDILLGKLDPEAVAADFRGGLWYVKAVPVRV